MSKPKPVSFPPEAKKQADERSELLRELAALTPPPVLKPGVVR